MRILHVLPLITARAGGPVAFATGAAEALDACGVSGTLFATDLGHVPGAGAWRSVQTNELPPNVERLDLHLFPVRPPRRLAHSPSMGARLDHAVREFDLVHIHSLWLFPQFAAQRAARRAGVPYIVSPHGALDPYLRRHGRLRKAVTDLAWQRRMLDDATVLHITTEQEGELIADVAPATPREVVPVGISTERLLTPGDGGRFRCRHLANRSGDIVLFLGRLTYKKGIDILIRSFTHVARERDDAMLVVAGPDDEHLQPQLEETVRSEGLEGRVVFPGALYQKDRADAFAAATVWALSSYTENFGVAVMEALAVGLPTVVSTEVNLADAIRKSDAGVVAGLDPAEFGEALLGLLTDHSRATGLGDRGRALAARYDWAEVAPQLETMYQHALSLRRSG